jgi:muramoyltetrapeptide carboxypeptidase
MKMPKLLRAGDTVAIIATSGPVNREKLFAGKSVLEKMGLRVRLFESCFATHDYLAGGDKLRLRDLHCAFADKNIRAIFVARGGYGAARLLPFINYKMISQNPKIFAGYSDVTALHIVLNQFCKLVTFHAPMPAADLFSADEVTIASFKKNIFFSRASPLNPQGLNGIITGGNLSVIASLIGTPYEINTRGKILFLEDTGEPPYRIDRLFLQLKMAGKFKDATGILLGDFSPENLATIKLAVSELIIPEGRPLVVGFPSGHCMPNLTLPLGKRVKIVKG